MDYNIKTTNVTLTDEIRNYIEKRFGSLDKQVRQDGDPRIDVELLYIESEEKQYGTKVLLHAPGTTEPLRAGAKGASLHEAIDAAAGELARELNKTKKKRIHVLRHTGARVKEFLRGWRKDI